MRLLSVFPVFLSVDLVFKSCLVRPQDEILTL
jgi:hypothetical protein